MVTYVAFSLVGLYMIGMLFVLGKTQRRCTCRDCKTDIHLERTSKPWYFKRYYNFLPLKAYRCRRCMATLFVPSSTRGVEPARMSNETLNAARQRHHNRSAY